MKLNLGCGDNILPGYCNVDKFGEPDIRHDLEIFPWPWDDNSIDEIQLIHTIEHIGRDSDTFISIMKELYRICIKNATINIVAPHPRHDHFISDPTHIRAVTAETFDMFSKKSNAYYRNKGLSNTPLATYHNVDFEIVHNGYTLDEPYYSLHQAGKIPADQLEAMIRTMNNIVARIQITLKVIK